MRIEAFSDIAGKWVETLHGAFPSFNAAMEKVKSFKAISWRIVSGGRIVQAPKGVVLIESITALSKGRNPLAF